MANKNLITFQRNQTPQTEKAAKGQKKNNAGGYTFTISDMDRLNRFLIMGSDSTFYQSGQQLTRENAKVVEKLIAKGKAKKVVDQVVEVSIAGRAAKQDYGVFVLALVAALAPEADERHYAYSKLNEVARTATTLFMFLSFFKQLRGTWPTGLNKAVRRWYSEKSVDSLAYQGVKYRNREGFTHRDALRISHPVADTSERNNLYGYLAGHYSDKSNLPSIVNGFERAKEATSAAEVNNLIREYSLSWEMIPNEFLNDPEVLKTFVKTMPYGALIRNVSRFAKAGIIEQNQKGSVAKELIERLTNEELIRKSRIHPMNILIASRAYSGGTSRYFTNRNTWPVNSRVVQAMEDAFYLAFQNVKPTGKRLGIFLDVSGSMGVEVMPGLSAAEASMAMALIFLKTEPNAQLFAFAQARGGWRTTDIVEIPVQATNSLTQAVNSVRGITFGMTDLAMPMQYAKENNLEFDAFIQFTDSETYYGSQHPHEALEDYRKSSGIQDAKMVVAAMTATRYSIANPKDSRMLDCAGMDSALPQIISNFIEGNV